MAIRDVIKNGTPKTLAVHNPDEPSGLETRFLMVDTSSGHMHLVLPDERDRLVKAQAVRDQLMKRGEKRPGELR